MITGSTARLILTLAMTTLLAACAVKPLVEWRDSNFTGMVDNVLIIRVSDQAAVRRLFEDSFVNELAALGVSARSSYQLLTDEQILSRDALEAAVDQGELEERREDDYYLAGRQQRFLVTALTIIPPAAHVLFCSRISGKKLRQGLHLLLVAVAQRPQVR